MGLKRLDTEDFVVSADSITATVWTGNTPSLTTFFTSSTQAASDSGKYYLNVYNTASALSGSEVQFSVTYGNKQGSGSVYYNTAVVGKSPTRSIYGQYRTLVLGDEYGDFIFGNYTASDFYAISIERTRYKEAILPGSLTLKLEGTTGTITLTDDSLITTVQSFKDAGRVFNIVSGSAGSINTTNANGWSANYGSYGWMLPDIGVLLLNSAALSQSIGLAATTTANTNGNNPAKLYSAINNISPDFTLNSQETITSDFVFVRARNAEFNYSENPSYISGSTGEVLYDLFINSPQSYITTVGMYNDSNELVAVAKLSKPLKKDFTKEALIRVKLDF